VHLNEINEFMEQSNARARRGRRLARLIFAVAVIPLVVVAFFFVAAPNGPQGLYLEEPQPHALAVAAPVIAILGIVIGLVWMVRILRADPEPDAKSWRYRDF
jgi:hypothetical protein